MNLIILDSKSRTTYRHRPPPYLPHHLSRSSTPPAISPPTFKRIITDWLLPSTLDVSTWHSIFQLVAACLHEPSVAAALSDPTVQRSWARSALRNRPPPSLPQDLTISTDDALDWISSNVSPTPTATEPQSPYGPFVTDPRIPAVELGDPWVGNESESTTASRPAT